MTGQDTLAETSARCVNNYLRLIMKKLLFIATGILLLMVSCKKNDNMEADRFAVTIGVKDVTDWSATLEGYASVFSWWDQKRCGFLISAGKAPTWDNHDRRIEASIHKYPCDYSVTIDGLLPETKYFYRAATWHDGGYELGDTKEFTTKAIEATITTEDAFIVNREERTFQMSAQLVYDKLNDGVPITVWFHFTESGNVGNIKSEYTKCPCTMDDGGKFHLVKEGLESYTMYYFVPAAEINGKVFYGPAKNFCTPDFSNE